MRDVQERAQARGIADGRGPQDGQIRTLLAFRGSLRSQADAGARVLRRVERARREGAQALGRVRAAWDGETGRPEAQGADGPEPGDGRGDQNPREDRRKGANRQAAEGRRSSEEVGGRSGLAPAPGSGGVGRGPWPGRKARPFLRTAFTRRPTGSWTRARGCRSSPARAPRSSPSGSSWNRGRG